MKEEYKIVLPKLGESIVSAVVVQWFKKEGDPISLDEPLLEVSTDKVNSEIPSPVAGVLKKILVASDEERNVGEVLAIVELGAVQQETLGEKAKPEILPEERAMEGGGKEFISPAVLRLAAEKGISLDALQKIKGTGAGGRITKQDVESFVTPKAPCPLQKDVAKSAVFTTSGEVEKIKMTGMRKAIADNMVKSFYEAPHASLIQEIDVTRVIKWIAAKKEEFFAKYQAKLTITGCILQALAKSLAEFPLLNSSLEQDTIVVKKQVNIGVAVSLDQGLIVPVVKNCQMLSLPEIAVKIQDLSQKARGGKLLPSDVLEGSITVTNFGMSGVLMGVPIIRHPEMAIVGIGAIKKQVKVLEEDTLAIRSVLHLSVTFDHRVIDGMYGCAFLSYLQKCLEEGLFLES
jgi:2-oxoglutarate dehydrogenase E2 component (dihydrolipoamide succinyltransferase)